MRLDPLNEGQKWTSLNVYELVPLQLLRRILKPGDTFVDGGALLANSPIRSGDQLFVPERSWFERNSNVLTAGISASVSIFIALMIRN